MSKKVLFALLLIALNTFLPINIAEAQIQVPEIQVDYTFGKQIIFTSTFQADTPIQGNLIYIQPDGQKETFSGEMTIDTPGIATFRYNPTTNPLRAFSKLTYWVEMTLPDGTTLSSPKRFFYYIDNRYDWHTRRLNPFVLHWYNGDEKFAQMTLDVAESGLENIQKLVPLPIPRQIDIYAYANTFELREALQISGDSWIGAHADPELAVMLIGLPSGLEGRLEMERQIPHELMHILLYEEHPSGYNNLPAWFNEGLASMAELYPNPDYSTLLENAHSREAILPISSLCTIFPRDASNAFLAYAEAASFTRYLYKQYGTSGIQSLADNYADGLDCETGIEQALGVSLLDLERQWQREVLGEVAYLYAINNFLPWILLMTLAIAIPVGLSIRGLWKRAKKLRSK